jgi:phage-related minor tail protein
MAPSQGIESAATLAATGRINGSLIPGLVSRSQRYADAFGMDQADALKELAKAFSDPVEGAKLLDERLGFLDAKTKEYIRTLKEQGNELGAQKALFDAFDASLKKTTDTTWSLTQAWRLFRSGLESPIQTIAGALDSALVAPKSGAQMAAERARAQRAALEQKANRDSIEITDRVTKFIPEIGGKRTLEDATAFFKNAEKNGPALAKLGVSMTDFSKAQDIANVKLQNFATETEKVRAATETRSKSMATLNEQTKADLEAQQTYTDTLRETGDRQLAAAKADAVRADALGRVNAAVRAYNDAAKEQLALAGLSPMQRARAQIGIEAENFKKQYGAVPSGVADRYAALNKQFNYDAFGAPMQDMEAQKRMLAVQKSGIGKSTFDSSFDSAYMEKYNQLVKEGIEITPQAVEQMNAYARAHADLAVEAEKVNRQEQEFRDGLDVTRSALKDLGASLVDAFRRGESAANAMLGVLDRLTSKLLDKTLDMGIDALLGKSGSSQTGMLGGLFAGVGKMLGFANGGIMTSAGPLPLMTYANGGVADRPQLAMFGEGRKPEAYVPLPDGKRIPVSLQGGGGGGNVTIHNYAGADVQAKQSPSGEWIIVMQKMIEANNQKIPGIVANSQRRSM